MPERIFPNSRFAKVLDETVVEIIRLRQLKGGEYAGDVDCLANFRSEAAANGIPMELVWKIYAGKHWAAVSTYIKDILDHKVRPRSEPIEGRLDDLILYFILLKAILFEREETAADEARAAMVAQPTQSAAIAG